MRFHIFVFLVAVFLFIIFIIGAYLDQFGQSRSFEVQLELVVQIEGVCFAVIAAVVEVNLPDTVSGIRDLVQDAAAFAGEVLFVAEGPCQ